MWKSLLLFCFMFSELNADTVAPRSFLLQDLKDLRGNLHSRLLKTVSRLIHINKDECPCPEDENSSDSLTHRQKCFCPNGGEQEKFQEDPHIDFVELGKAYHEGFLEGVRNNGRKHQNQPTAVTDTFGADSEEKHPQHAETKQAGLDTSSTEMIQHQAEDEGLKNQSNESHAGIKITTHVPQESIL